MAASKRGWRLLRRLSGLLNYIDAPEDRRRVWFLIAINGVLLVVGLLVMLGVAYTGGQAPDLRPLVSTAALSAAVLLLIAVRRYRQGIGLFVAAQVALSFLNFALFGPANVLYVVTSFLAVSVFLRSRRAVVVYLLILLAALMAASFLTRVDPAYASVGHRQVFYFVVVGVVFVALIALVNSDDMAQIERQNRLLHESEARMRAILNSAPGLINVFDRDLRLVDAYRSKPSAPAVPLEGSIGSSLEQLVPPQAYERALALARHVLDEGAVISSEDEGLGGRWYATRAAPIVENGQITGAVAISLDITESREMVKALRLSEERYRLLAENSSDMIALLNADGSFAYASPSFTRVLGYTTEELLAMPAGAVPALAHPDDMAGACQSASQEVLAGKRQTQVEGRMRHKHGGYLWVEASFTPILGPDGEVKQMLLAIRVIERRKQAQERQRRLTAELQAANRNLEDFAHLVSHDLRAPLRGISAVADWLVSDHGDTLGTEGRKLVDLLLERVGLMEQLIDGVLAYSRIGHVSEARTVVDLDALVTEIAEELVPTGRFSIVREGQLPTFIIEPTYPRQIFQNLIDNAVKFMDKPNGEIRIGCRLEGPDWLFWVQDNGPGIDPRHFERIFQIFQTLPQGGGTESTGVGLTIVKRIVELLGGKIRVQSVPGEGSTFSFTLPAVFA